MTRVTFIDSSTISVTALDGETLILKPLFPIPEKEQKDIAAQFAYYFEKNFSDDKSSMVYRVFCDMFGVCNFSWISSDRDEERKRIGMKIRQLREEKGMDAKSLAKLADIDAANLSRIEQGRYSVGLNILSQIAGALGVKIDLV